MVKVQPNDESDKMIEYRSTSDPLLLIGQLFDSFWDGVIFVDSDGFIRKANRTMVELSGYLISEIEGLPVEALIPDVLRSRHAYLRENYQRNPAPREMGGELEIELQNKNGERKTVDVSLQPFSFGETSGVIVAVRDKSEVQTLKKALYDLEIERKSLSEKRGGVNAEIAALLFSSMTPAVVIDRMGMIKRINHAFEFTRLEADSYRIGENLFDLVSIEDPRGTLQNALDESRLVGPIQINRGESRINTGASSLFVWPIHRFESTGTDEMLIQFNVDISVSLSPENDHSISLFVRQLSQVSELSSFLSMAAGEITRKFSGISVGFFSQTNDGLTLYWNNRRICGLSNDGTIDKYNAVTSADLSALYLLGQLRLDDTDYLLRQAMIIKSDPILAFDALESVADKASPLAMVVWIDKAIHLSIAEKQEIDSYLSCVRSVFSISCARWKQQYWQELIGTVSLGILVAALDGTIIFQNAAAATLLQESSGKPGSSKAWFNCVSCEVLPFSTQFNFLLSKRKVIVQEGLIRQRRHPSIPVKMVFRRLTISNKEVDAIVVTFEDATRLAEAQGLVAHISNYDSLTNLPNLDLCSSRIDAILNSDKRRNLGVLVVRLDRFKDLRAARGSQAGDELVRKAAARLVSKAHLGEMVARIDTDEFAVICTTANSEIELAKRSDEFDFLLRQPFDSPAGEVYFTPHFGLAMVEDASSAQELLLRAGMGTRSMKLSHSLVHARLQVVDFSSLAADIDVEMALHRAIDAQELEAHFQPQVNLASGALVGAEALVRWRRPGYGLVLPADFLDIAESVGLIGELGRTMLQQSCEVLSQWESKGIDLSVSVNVSGSQLASPGFVNLVKTIVQAYGVRPESLMLELTETAFLGDIDAALYPMRKLQAFGVRFSIDDFGTGYSSMTYLRKLPFSEMKLDRSFVSGVVANAGDRAILAAMIKLGTSLNIVTIAEGIENSEQRTVLTEMGCQLAQGYFFGRPAPLDSGEWTDLILLAKHRDLA